MEATRLPFVPDTPDDGLVVLHQYHVSETYPLHSHEFYEFFFVIAGQAMHQVNGSFQVVDEGTLVFIRPQDEHCYQFLHLHDFEFVNVNIRPELAAKAFRWMRIPQSDFDAPALPPSIRLSGSAQLEMRRHFLELSQTPPGAMRHRRFCALVSNILLELCTQFNRRQEQPIPPWLTEVLRQLEQPENFICGLPALLSMTPYTQEHLTRSFRKYLHITPTAYINQRRLTYVSELLLEGNVTPQEAAQAAGFHNVSHFYHLFREQYGCTPLQITEYYRDADRSRQARLFDICRRAALECAQHNAARILLKNGLFAYFMQDGLAQIYLSLSCEATEEELHEAFSCWDPRITPGATVHINRDNPALFEMIRSKYGQEPRFVLSELTLSRAQFEQMPDPPLPEGLSVRESPEEEAPRCAELAMRALGSASLRPIISRALAEAGNDRPLLLLSGGETVGLICASGESLPLFCLLPEAAEQGLEVYLLRAALQRVFSGDISQCFVTVPDSCENLLARLQALGFTRTGHEAVFVL